ncbi:MAG: PEGA domain-containing protein [Candidatus Eisenbacteria bacterium]|nr:PEGA domain-containing protein [Candidatus Eisenbacteria bacterium]
MAAGPAAGLAQEAGNREEEAAAGAQAHTGIETDAGEGSWIVSEPPGASVALDGPVRIRGRTPLRLDSRVSGHFSARARLAGYETWTGSLTVDGRAHERVTLVLNSKSRLEAVARSMVIPGWGQMYAGSSAKGRLFLAAEILALAGLWLAHEEYDNRMHEYREAKYALHAERYEENLPARRRELRRRVDRADDMYKLREALAYAAGGVWALNILDIVLLTPVGPSSGNVNVQSFGYAPAISEPGGLQARAGIRMRF